MIRQRLLLSWLLAALLCGGTARATDYALAPTEIAANTYVLVGANEDFSFRNGGNIVNVGFIVTGAGVVVINTGPSRLYGEQLRAAIGAVTEQPVVQVFISKLHPDHFLGNQAFADVPIAALAATVDGIRAQGEQFTDNMYRLVGHWMQGTEPLAPTEIIADSTLQLGDHRLRLIGLRGHTPGDLVILDQTTGVLFAGGVAFHQRAPTTPHADLNLWVDELDRLARLDFARLVPSHGPVAAGPAPIAQTRDYVSWLDRHFAAAASSGLSAGELLYQPIPERFHDLAVLAAEYQRSVSHLYARYEAAALPRAVGGAD